MKSRLQNFFARARREVLLCVRHGCRVGLLELMKFYVKNLAAIALGFGLASFCAAQNAPVTQPADQPKPADTPPAAPTPLPTPAIVGPLQGQPPFMFDAGPFGKIAVNGILKRHGHVAREPRSRR